jgi:hypothetical protein
MLWGLFQKKFFATPEIHDTRLRVAAELVDSVEGKKGDRIVTERDLKNAKSALDAHDKAVSKKRWDQSPLKSLMVPEIEVMRAGLPELNQFLHATKAEVPKPFCTSLLVDALANDDTRDTAIAMINCFKPGTSELNLGQLLDTKRVLTDIARTQPAALPFSDAIRAAAKAGPIDSSNFPTKSKSYTSLICDAVTKGDIDPDEFTKLDLYMLTGKGGLATHPVEILGTPFEAYRIPVDKNVIALEPTEKLGINDSKVWESFMYRSPAAGGADSAGGDQTSDTGDPKTPDAPNGDLGTPNAPTAAPPPDDAPSAEDSKAAAGPQDGQAPAPDDGPNDLDKLLDRYEQKFERTGYDRIYIRESDKLYVALNSEGSVSDIRPGYRVTMHNDNHLGASGEVLRVVDTNNTIKKATVGFWRSVIGKTMSALRSLFTKKLDNTIAKETSGATSNAGGDKGTIQSMALAATAVGATGVAAAINLPIAAGAVGVATLGVTAANVVDCMATPRNKTPYLSAAGVTVNRRTPVVY